MINQNDLVTMLKTGKTQEEVAEYLTNMLNSAVTETKRQQLEEEKARKEAEEKAKRENTKKEKAKALYNYIIDFIKEYYPEIEIENATISDKDISDVLNSLDELYEALVALKKLQEKENKKYGRGKIYSAEDPIESFLKLNGLM